MMPPMMGLDPQAMLREWTELGRQTVTAVDALGRIDAEEIEVGFSPKEAVWSPDRVTLYRYTPVVESPWKEIAPTTDSPGSRTRGPVIESRSEQPLQTASESARIDIERLREKARIISTSMEFVPAGFDGIEAAGDPAPRARGRMLG